jgi:hypothetical protein
LNYRFRHFLYQILQNELSIDELIRYRLQLKQFHHVKQMDIDQVKRFIDLLPNEYNDSFPLTLTDKLLQRLKWDGKILEKEIRDQLLKVRVITCPSVRRLEMGKVVPDPFPVPPGPGRNFYSHRNQK